MSPPAILIVTGASGAGKTTAVRALEAQALPGVACYYFDSIGVPSLAEMQQRHGGPEAWQAAATEEWIGRLGAVTASEVVVLDGQVRPSVVRRALRRVPALRAQIVLLDCAPAERARRLAGPRGQAELATPQMDAWAAYLRGQADALELPVLDTTAEAIADVAAALAREVERLRRPDAPAARLADRATPGALAAEARPSPPSSDHGSP
jgi:hypothetical protein